LTRFFSGRRRTKWRLLGSRQLENITGNWSHATFSRIVRSPQQELTCLLFPTWLLLLCRHHQPPAWCTPAVSSSTHMSGSSSQTMTETMRALPHAAGAPVTIQAGISTMPWPGRWHLAWHVTPNSAQVSSLTSRHQSHQRQPRQLQVPMWPQGGRCTKASTCPLFCTLDRGYDQWVLCLVQQGC
jgi:hypothetical protein